MEMGKLAEEVHLLRQEFKGGKERNSSEQSGWCSLRNYYSVVVVEVFLDFDLDEGAGLFEQLFNGRALGITDFQHQHGAWF